MADDGNVFNRITSEKERERVLEELKFKSIILAGLTKDQHQFLLNVRAVNQSDISVEVIAPAGRALKAGEPIQVVFGLPDGQYLIRSKVEPLVGQMLMINVGNEMYRMQRRKNFRTKVPSKHTVIYDLMAYKTKPVGGGAQLTALDLSVGGARMTWPSTAPAPEVGAHLTGMMTLPSGKQLEIFGVIKNVYPGPRSESQVGVEFQNVSLRDEQALLFVCLQFQREQLRPGK